jgi:hypothetical protein
VNGITCPGVGVAAVPVPETLLEFALTIPVRTAPDHNDGGGSSHPPGESSGDHGEGSFHRSIELMLAGDAGKNLRIAETHGRR